ncbi:intermembrane transport protein PqiB [Pectobacterium atrosepticum]|uniref:PqiB family protein n=1 Tax=Pectobacterium atrosepticum TaxID=29471 RepID=UPI00039A303F|nr:MlaD family protein [Pectobacterium atrosepticum]ATY90327.1 MCE family protein [Pectobacterium atrosepticum]MBL0894845.1 MCE family protein [Pectobacterium atrosepticum]MCA6979136.1 MlaD family protein [Pectobacterium atrosepticum]MCH5020328.1 MCE family protein [Pectobacterium atrosepticum]PWD64292.1 MCE family protein [Pectobacterium atrosepticum]
MIHEQPSDPVIIRQRWRISLIWLVPALAMLTGLAMLIHTWSGSGPKIVISFQSATGLEADRTVVKYKDVAVGIVKDITLSQDSKQVLVTVLLNKNAESLAHAGSRFWVVRPRVGINGVTGIDTLLSGAYIGADKGESTQGETRFTGLESPPAVINGMPGSRFVIQADDLGSLDSGSPVYYRRIPVGRVASYQLNNDGHGVQLQVFIDAPYDRFVTPHTRFWNASGMDLSVDANGFRLRTQTLAAVVAGGIDFSTPDLDNAIARPEPLTTYKLARDQESALLPPDGPPILFKLRFDRSLHGLEVGAPVEFSSVKIGHVATIELDYSKTGYRFPTVVNIEVFPNRLGNVLDKLPKQAMSLEQQTAEFTRDLVEHGLRAQVAPSNLLTGQLYISLDFVHDAAKVPFDINAQPLVLPTVNGGFDRLQTQIASIIGKIDNMPLDAIGRNMNTTLIEANKALRQVNGQTLPEASRLMKHMQQATRRVQDVLEEDSPLQLGITQSLQEIQRTLRALRSLAEQIERHPESLLQGRSNAPSPSTFTHDTATPKGASK